MAKNLFSVKVYNNITQADYGFIFHSASPFCGFQSRKVKTGPGFCLSHFTRREQCGMEHIPMNEFWYVTLKTCRPTAPFGTDPAKGYNSNRSRRRAIPPQCPVLEGSRLCSVSMENVSVYYSFSIAPCRKRQFVRQCHLLLTGEHLPNNRCKINIIQYNIFRRKVKNVWRFSS